MLALHAYNSTKKADPDLLERILFSVKQQAGVLAAICGAIFGVITALQSAKLVGMPSESSSSLPSVSFGKRSYERPVIEQPPATSVG